MKPTILNRIRAQASAIAKSDLRTRVTWAFYLLACTAMLTSPAFGQIQGDDPWSKAASNLAGAVTGPIAKGLSMVSIVAGGLGMAFGEGQAKKTIAGIVGGTGLALAGAQIINWLYPTATQLNQSGT